MLSWLYYLSDLLEMRIFYFTLGWVFFSLGAVGVLVPVLPTTPFMILALWAFAKSSMRFHQWLYNHRFFGPPLQQWEQYRIIPRAAKIMAISVMSLSLGYLLLFTSAVLWLKICTALLMFYGAFFILTKPSRVRSEQKSQ